MAPFEEIKAGIRPPANTRVVKTSRTSPSGTSGTPIIDNDDDFDIDGDDDILGTLMLVMVAAVVKADVAVVVGFGAIKASAELTSIIHRIVVLCRVENTIFL